MKLRSRSSRATTSSNVIKGRRRNEIKRRFGNFESATSKKKSFKQRVRFFLFSFSFSFPFCGLVFENFPEINSILEYFYHCGQGLQLQPRRSMCEGVNIVCNLRDEIGYFFFLYIVYFSLYSHCYNLLYSFTGILRNVLIAHVCIMMSLFI